MNTLKNRLKLTLLTPFLLAGILGTLTAHAQEDVIRKRFAEHVAPPEAISNVKKAPYADLYEVQIEDSIVYTDSKATVLFVGRFFDIETRQDLTSARAEAVNRISFSDLPLKQAIKIVNGNGERAIAVFSDPNCIYCKRLDKMLKDIENITIYVFPLNILSEKSRTLSRNIWCSADPAKAWMAWMTEETPPVQAKNDCAYTDKEVAEFARQSKITGTPVIIFQNGARITGLPPIKRLNQMLSDSK